MHDCCFCISPKLPGCNGPNPQLSTGAKSMELVKDGKFVDIAGSKSVTLEHGVWEMIWRNNAKAGKPMSVNFVLFGYVS